MRNFEILGIVFILVCLVVSAIDYKPRGNVDMQDRYNITNIEYFCDGASCYNLATLANGSGGGVASSLNWTGLKNYPVECPNGTVIKQLNDSVTCINPTPGMVYVSNFPTVQQAITVAGVNGTVIFDPSGSPYVLSSALTFYNGQTIILHADIHTSAYIIMIDLAGLNGVNIIANGHTLDGGGAGWRGISSDSSTYDCHMRGVIHVKNTVMQGLYIQGKNMTFDTIFCSDIGNQSANNNMGDCVNFGSLSKALNCHVEKVISNNVTRHAVTFGSQVPEYCSVGRVMSYYPGGAHLAMESSYRGYVGYIYGIGARNALTYSPAPQQNYTGYPEIAIVGTSDENTIDFVHTEYPAGGDQDYTNAALRFSTGCELNIIRDFTSVNSSSHGIVLHTTAKYNYVGIRKITNCGYSGIWDGNTAQYNEFEGIGKGEISNCQKEGITVLGGSYIKKYTKIHGLHIHDNIQSGGGHYATAGISIDNEQTHLTIFNNVIENGTTSSQSIGIYSHASDSYDYIRIWGNDVSNEPTPYSLNSIGTNKTEAANLPAIGW